MRILARVSFDASSSTMFVPPMSRILVILECDSTLSDVIKDKSLASDCTQAIGFYWDGSTLLFSLTHSTCFDAKVNQSPVSPSSGFVKSMVKFF